jgi:NAD(P)-dependent dehydrogenase (short-subunit alcohol dehydrogenase family)
MDKLVRFSFALVKPTKTVGFELKCARSEGKRVFSVNTERQSLKGKSAIITGSTSGIGLGIASALNAQGCSVMLNGFGDPAQIQNLCRELFHRNKAPVEYHSANVSNPSQIADLVRTTEAKFGGIDILVNNAGLVKFYS